MAASRKSKNKFKNLAFVAGFIAIIFTMIAMTGFADRVKEGDRIKVHYIGYLDDGTPFDSTSGKDPFEFTVGSGVIKGFSDAVTGKRVGDEVSTVAIL